MSEEKRNITKKDIVEEIAEKTGLTKSDTKIIVNQFLEQVVNAISDGSNIEIRGFGRFKVKEKQARMARNPKTGESIAVKAGVKPLFEPSRDLISRCNKK